MSVALMPNAISAAGFAEAIIMLFPDAAALAAAPENMLLSG